MKPSSPSIRHFPALSNSLSSRLKMLSVFAFAACQPHHQADIKAPSVPSSTAAKPIPPSKTSTELSPLDDFLGSVSEEPWECVPTGQFTLGEKSQDDRLTSIELTQMCIRSDSFGNIEIRGEDPAAIASEDGTFPLPYKNTYLEVVSEQEIYLIFRYNGAQYRERLESTSFSKYVGILTDEPEK